MKLRLLISISLVAWMANHVAAQSADDLFHSGASSYLSNNIPGAREEVDKGLKLYPDDIKLKKLDELLKQQQQQQNQQQQQQQSQSQQDQSQQKKDQEKQQQQKQDEQKQQEQNKPQQEKQDEEQQQKEQQAAAGQMTPAQAKQMLDSQKGNELLLPAANRNEKQRDRQHPLKDW